MREPFIAYLDASMNISKGLKKSRKASTGAVHKNYFSFSKAYYCSVSQIHGCCYYNKIEIGKTTRAKDPINPL